MSSRSPPAGSILPVHPQISLRHFVTKMLLRICHLHPAEIISALARIYDEQNIYVE